MGTHGSKLLPCSCMEKKATTETMKGGEIKKKKRFITVISLKNIFQQNFTAHLNTNNSLNRDST